MPYWIAETLAATPAFIGLYFGVGIPWALVLLPRRDWRRSVEVIALAIPVGAAVVTVWMFALGTVGTADTPLLRPEYVFSGALGWSLVGLLIALVKARRGGEGIPPPTGGRLAFDERLLIGLIAAALIVRWVVIAYWPFTIYDALWVYGYQGRLYTLVGHLPDMIGYYPQFLSLQYTFGQLAFGAINDHAARAGLPILHLGAILAAYVLGARLVNRRTGIYAAALWGLYPHVGEWSRGGDLEILLAQMFTLAAAYFLLAWFTPDRSRRGYAVIAGVLLGIGLWTKPTMGAFIWGVAGLTAFELVRGRFSVRRALPRLEVVLLTALACLPIGGLWYVRNLLLGHAAVDFPPDFWLTQAARSGVEFGWPLLFGGVALACLYAIPRTVRPDPRWLWGGTALIALALFPSIVSPRRLTVWEVAALLIGCGLVIRAVLPWLQTRSAADRRLAAIAATGAGLALPYFLTWFWSYSYHYRLSFAIVPLLILPTAILIGRWSGRWQGERAQARWRVPIAAGLITLGLPGVVSAVYDTYTGWDYLFTDEMPDDHARYASGNPALMNVVDGLNIWLNDNPGQPLRVVAPGIDRLPFFFPDPIHQIDVDSVPTRLDDLGDDVYFIYGAPESVGRYERIPPLYNQVLGALGRVDILRRAWGMDDGIFRYDVYELHLDRRFAAPQPNGPAAQDVRVGEPGAAWARYLGYDIGGLELWPGRRVVFRTFWQVLSPPPADWMLYVHLLDETGTLIANWDGPINPTREGYYSTRLWQPGEYVIDERVIQLPDGIAPVGSGYRLVVGFYDFRTGERVPVSVDGAPAAGVLVENRMSIQAAPPG